MESYGIHFAQSVFSVLEYDQKKAKKIKKYLYTQNILPLKIALNLYMSY